MRWKSRQIARERKSGVVTIKQALIRISSVTIRWETRKIMRKRKSGAVTIKQVVIRISSVTISWERRKKKNVRQKKLCSLHNSTNYSNQECFQQRSSSTYKDSDGRNSEDHETYVVDSKAVGCKSCCCSNGKVAKKSNEESKVEYSPPPGIGFSLACCHPPLSQRADGFQMLRAVLNVPSFYFKMSEFLDT